MKLEQDTGRFMALGQNDNAASGWQALDVILISGDAYVDHPSFGTALIGRLLESAGYTVGIIAQPDWKTPGDFLSLGKPRLFFGITAGAMDSMVANYSSPGKRRKKDGYSPGGQAGLRPDRAVIVYTNRIRELFGNITVIIGGIEASLRRLAHYDFWTDSVRRSILLDSRADLLIYGMGETAIIQAAARIAQSEPLNGIPGTAWVSHSAPEGSVALPSFEEVTRDKDAFNRAFVMAEEEHNPYTGKPMTQQHGERWVVVEPPAMPLSAPELDRIYNLPFLRRYHPVYEKSGGIPALDEVLFSITAHRGCPGQCSFCTLAAHQGRIVQARSDESILTEAKSFGNDTRFKGIIHDVGGPSANIHQTVCDQQTTRGACRARSCLFPEPCRRFRKSAGNFVRLLRQIRELPKVRRVFVRSGVRFDVALLDENREFLDELVRHHVSGQLKVAPEHVDDRVLKRMGKPPHATYVRFSEEFGKLSAEAGKEQYLVPYFISGHPGATLESAVSLAEYIRDQGRFFEQVQDFVPLPMTRSAAQWYTGRDPWSGETVHVPNSQEERALHRALLQYQLPKNRNLVRKALRQAGRTDLIGFCPKCLVPPETGHPNPRHAGKVRYRGRKMRSRPE